MALTSEQLQRWTEYRDTMFEDKDFIVKRREREHQRKSNPKDAVKLLESYLKGKIDNETLRSEFQSKTMNEWKTFGLSGFSGAMFLNMLVNNVPDQDEVSRQIKQVLPLPSNKDKAYERLSSFMDYLLNVVNSGVVSRRKLQIAHAPFFVSAWWHFQNQQEWPIYYVSGRKAFTSENLYEATNDPVDDYFAFSDVYLELKDHLNLTPYETEDLGIWYRERKDGETTASDVDSPTVVIEDDDADVADEEETISHSAIQLLLAQIGRKMGCTVWIASNDHNRYANGERLGDYSVNDLPPYIVADPDAQKIIKLIDVLWLKGSRGVAAAFEIEHTTSIYSGLLRMSDLLTLQPNIAFPLYIVTSVDRIDKVKRELSRPTFQTLQLHNNCGFFSYEELLREKDNIMRWAKSPEAIDALASYVPTILDE